MRIPGLDGLRALAILLVLGQHLHAGGWIGYFQPNLGRLGVALFFALSGYLITGILLDNPRGLGRFYWRRSLRIFPAFYVYWVTLVILVALGLQSVSPLALFAAATYWINWLPAARGWSVQHLWSLAVEEQFYLAWPLLMRWVGPRGAQVFIGLAFLVWPLQRWWRRGTWGHPTLGDALFSVTYDAILWGCLMALWKRQGRHPLFGLATAPATGWIPWVVVWALYADWLLVHAALAPYLRNACLAWIVAWVAENSSSFLVQVLHFRPLRWLGERSYSLYLWHPLFFTPALRVYFSWWVAVTLALLLAELSYRLVERPILAWRDNKDFP